jgi:hypothetical protein
MAMLPTEVRLKLALQGALQETHIDYILGSRCCRGTNHRDRYWKRNGAQSSAAAKLSILALYDISLWSWAAKLRRYPCMEVAKLGTLGI